MRCKVYTFFAFLAFLFLSFTISFLNVNDTFALEDLILTWSASDQFNKRPCNSSTGSNGDICGYSFVTVEYSSSRPSNGLTCLGIYNGNVSMNLSFSSPYSTISTFQISSLPDTSSFRCLPSFGLTGDDLITMTLSENAPTGSCPEPPEPEPCPVIPENPYDEKLDSINSSIIMVSATALVIYFFFCFYRMFIKPLGGL